MSEVDEDTVNLDDTLPASEGEVIPEIPKRVGRPPGIPKSPLSGRIAEVLPSKVVLKELIAFHRSVVEGKLFPKLGPTGKHLPGGTAPTLQQRQVSAAALARLLEMAAAPEPKALPTYCHHRRPRLSPWWTMPSRARCEASEIRMRLPTLMPL
jgi:hypothetical protein